MTVLELARRMGWGSCVPPAIEALAGFPIIVKHPTRGVVVLALTDRAGRITADQERWLGLFDDLGMETTVLPADAHSAKDLFGPDPDLGAWV